MSGRALRIPAAWNAAIMAVQLAAIGACLAAARAPLTG